MNKRRKTRKKSKLLYADLSYKIKGICFELYKELGCGHKETIYQKALEKEFKNKDLPYKSAANFIPLE